MEKTILFKPIDERGIRLLAAGIIPRELKVKIIMADGSEYIGRVQKK